MKTNTLTAPAVNPAPIVARFSTMQDASPFITAQKVAGLYVTVEHIGEGLKGEEYMRATAEYAFVVTARPFVVGDGATIHGYSDAHAGTVIARTAKTLTVQYDKATLLNGVNSGEKDALQFSPGGFVGHTSGRQRYSYTADPEGQKYVARLTKCGWRSGRSNIGAGRWEHYDYNF